ncbi:RNA polymerase sigma-70 factor [Fulvivirgaceae bacterium BMA10]|uniref:RNA polymerase sigma factor n=1 Tax=Splendidivirga corallicola TaxID=3051826 RepID=A0ABT8KUZ1_9BACT|nr:RNA polymerase sigma-70 factor [Fulvivirgaceae bacterium BMA10]
MTVDDFKSLFNEHYDGIKNFLYYKTGDVEVAEDIAQDVFLKAWDKRSDIRLETVKSFLYTIANNLAINHLKHRNVVFDFVRKERNDSSYESPEFQLEVKEFDQRLQQTLAAMPEKNREVFLMNRIEKLTYNDIAERLGLSVKAIEKRMSGALSYLRDKLKHPI